MFTINWVLTFCSVAIALVVLRRRGEVKDGVAFLPVTVILSIPTIRSLYVGSPPFGISLGTRQNRPAFFFQGLTPPFRYVGVLPKNVDSAGLRHDSIVGIYDAVCPGQRRYP